MKKIYLMACVILLTLGMAANVSAQDLPYYFQVNKEVVHVYWNSDGTQSLDYTWTFTNQPKSHPIDFVDVGMPNSNFHKDTIKAEVDGAPVSISSGDYQGNGSGFAIVLGSKTIPAGGTGTVHVYVGRLTNVLYPDDKDEAYASATFAPTWFGSQYVTGKTDFTMTFHLPPNMKEQEPRWHAAPAGFPSEPQTGYDSDNRVTYTWYLPSASASSSYLFGASFPRTYVPADSIVIPAANPLISGDTLFTLLCCGFFVFIFAGLPTIAAVNSRRRKMQYMPPRVAIEGHGIKRGLTAVEAAILLEQPLDKVMTMILFGTLKKNAAQVVSRDPLEVRASDPLPDKLHEYELDFLKAFKEPAGKERQKKLQDMTVRLVKSLSEKLRGFSRKETIDYYKSITEKAWAIVEAADTPEVKSQKFDEALEWTMLDKNYDDRTRRVFTGPIFLPHWWGSYNPTYKPASASAPTMAPSSRGNALPGADYAAQMVTGVQTFSQKVVGNINTFTEKVTGATNPPPKPTSSGRGRGGGSGGRSCACACACAGCACACAGGGR
ncbi:MAG: hypothetical protein C4586_06210 [Anaerolineaceae bacterium]|nr:MAG: hypothetical protein C4586_06210 [Anaerolineaceae bacterium]